jgi:glycosyltransferase involved in cell wall biosynthesis
VVRPRLVCLREEGSLAPLFRSAGFDVEVLDRSGRFDTTTLPRLVRSLRDHRDDAVMVTHHHRAALLLGRLAAKLARVPVNVVAAHDMDLVEVGGRVLPRWAVASLPMSDALVLLSPGQGDYLRDKEGVGSGLASTVREVVIPNGIVIGPPPTSLDRSRARDLLGLGEDAFVIGIVARLSYQKSHEVLLQAMVSVHRAHPQARLVVVGGGDRESELRRLTTTLGLDDVVQFLGTRDDVGTIVGAFDVFALSSVHEGVPIAVIEAMAAGLPVVATDCGSLRDMIGDGEQGFIVPVGSSEQLAQRLTLLADDPALRLRLGRSARERAEQEFRIEETARRYQALLTELVRQKVGDPVGA